METKKDEFEDLPSCEELIKQHAAKLAQAKRRFPDEEV